LQIIQEYLMKINNESDVDLFDELTEEQQKSVLKSLEQADNGETISHEEALKKLGLLVDENK